jgi:hypothetical protein
VNGYKQFGWRNGAKYAKEYSLIEHNNKFYLTVTKLNKTRVGYIPVQVTEKEFIFLKEAQDWIAQHV